jgi:hypothetical protein
MNPEVLSKDILRAFLHAELPAHGHQVDEDLLDKVETIIRLSIDENNLDNQYRWLFYKEGVDFRPTVESIKLYNKVQIDLLTLLRFGAAGSVSVIGENMMIKLALSTFLVILEFINTKKVKFNDDDAKILLAIYKLNTKEFDKAQVIESYRAWFAEDINANELDRSMAFMVHIESIESLGNDRYRRIEKIVDMDRKII